MTPTSKIMKTIMLQALEHGGVLEHPVGPLDTDEQVQNAYCNWNETDAASEYESGFRYGETVTDIPAPSSRHYESRSVAARMYDGSWVGWTFWYGGGKHGEPEAIDWMGEAYELGCKEEEKLVVVRTWTRK